MREVGGTYTILGLIQCMKEGHNAPLFIKYYDHTFRYSKEDNDYIDVDDYKHYLSQDIACFMTDMVDIFNDVVEVVESPIAISSEERGILWNLFRTYTISNEEDKYYSEDFKIMINSRREGNTVMLLKKTDNPYELGKVASVTAKKEYFSSLMCDTEYDFSLLLNLKECINNYGRD